MLKFIDYVWFGKWVLCLKGGDLFVFGCGGEEVLGLVEVYVFFCIIFGIMVGIGGLVYVGIFVMYCDCN